MGNLTEIVKSKLNIVDEIRKDGVILKKELGGRYTAKCPFHNEKTPSFKVNEDLGFFHCFGCGEKGDVISYFAKRNQISYYESVLEYAKRLNIPIDNKSLVAENKEYEKQKRLLHINKIVKEYYISAFNSLEDAHKAKIEITKRGLSSNNEAMYYGYAPDNNDLLSLLKENGIKKEDLEELGITKNGRLLLKDRLVFFIHSYLSDVVGFSGRVLKDTKEFKYINSKSSVVYNKQRALYNIERAKAYSKKKGYMFIVEGLFDVIAMLQRGYKETVAICGTALTKEHIKYIRRATDNGKIILLLDGDKAGITSMYKIFKEFKDIQGDLYIIVLPNGQDPCEYLKDNKRLPKPTKVVDYIYESIKSRYDITNVSEQTEFLKDLKENLISCIADVDTKNIYLKNAHSIIGITHRDLKDTKSIKENEKVPEINEDYYYLSSLGFYMLNKNHIKDIDCALYPVYLKDFIIEIKNTNDYSSIKNTKYLEYILDNIEIAKIKNEKIAVSHYNMLLQKGNDLKKQREERETYARLLQDFKDITEEEKIRMLKELS